MAGVAGLIARRAGGRRPCSFIITLFSISSTISISRMSRAGATARRWCGCRRSRGRSGLDVFGGERLQRLLVAEVRLDRGLQGHAPASAPTTARLMDGGVRCRRARPRDGGWCRCRRAQSARAIAVNDEPCRRSSWSRSPSDRTVRPGRGRVAPFAARTMASARCFAGAATPRPWRCRHPRQAGRKRLIATTWPSTRCRPCRLRGAAADLLQPPGSASAFRRRLLGGAVRRRWDHDRHRGRQPQRALWTGDDQHAATAATRLKASAVVYPNDRPRPQMRRRQRDDDYRHEIQPGTDR